MPTSDAFILLAMLAGFLCFTITLVMSLVFDPAFLLLAGWVVLALFVEHRHPAPRELAEAHASPPVGPAA